MSTELVRVPALIDAHALMDLRPAPDDTAADGPLLLDVRWTLAGADRDGYRAGHVPGAVFVDLDTELAEPPGDGGRHPLPGVERLTALVRRVGVVPGRTVVVYDGGAGAAAARAWWCLRWAGHADVRVLDGGLAAWVAAGGTLAMGDVPPRPAPDAVVVPGQMPVVDADAVLAGAAGALLDARAPERFRGATEPVDPVAGHIPGATSCPTTAVQRADGTYLEPAELRRVLDDALAGADDGSAGGDPGGGGGAATAYCGSGVTAAQLVLAAHEAGVELALFPGSWSEWIRDPSRPVATGP
ncbi:sulfurtransferase [Cellulomonas sp. APG4]|uniref:sulfurtransferase n=1 Tax=Cellulomonas sp. APG4 TaxID=1538656 RepID=UPI001379CDC9|nr:rhodanese-like domain-containing protein [Cellulomonas sp. APG4]NCT92586.1 sulfurtransferase [Cellulomonas sp. APG4]